MNNPLFDQIKNKFAVGDFHGVEKICFQLYQNDKKNFNVIKNLALACLLQNKYFESVHFYNEALLLDENDFDINCNLSFLFAQTEQFEKSLKFAHKAIQINPISPIPLKQLGEVFLKLREFEKAKNYLSKALELIEGAPNLNETFLNELNYRYMESLSALNENEELKSLTSKNLKINLNPDILSFYIKSFGSIDDMEIIKNAENELEKILSVNSPKNLKHAAGYAFCLANFYLSKDNKLKAEKYFHDGNKLIHSSQNYRPLQTQSLIKKLIESFDNLPTLNIDPNTGKEIIFVVGMPRSGTTLLESIIANSPDVFSGGEMSSFKNLVQYDVTTISKGNADQINEFVQKYIEKMRFLLKSKKMLIDKLPFNGFLIGFITKLLPSAKIIVIDRNPWDTATSIYEQYYVDKHYYSSTFFNIAMQIANFNYIKNYWIENCDQKNIYQIKYEDLVTDSQKFSKEIYNHLELSHKLDPEKRKGFYSSTASYVQVKGDITQKSLKKEIFSSEKQNFLENLENQKSYWVNQT